MESRLVEFVQRLRLLGIPIGVDQAGIARPFDGDEDNNAEAAAEALFLFLSLTEDAASDPRWKLPDDEEAMILDKLKSLGYME